MAIKTYFSSEKFLLFEVKFMFFSLGSEFVKAVSGFRCQLCKTFMRHGHQIIQHLKGKKHNANYEVSFSSVFLLLCLKKPLSCELKRW
jgi:hypothetical protein